MDPIVTKISFLSSLNKLEFISFNAVHGKFKLLSVNSSTYGFPIHRCLVSFHYIDQKILKVKFLQNQIKRVSTLSILACCINLSYAQETAWLSNIDEAQVAAKAENKLILIEFRASWSVPCLKVEQGLLNTPEGQGLLCSFILVKVDFDKNSNLANTYNVTSVPSIIIADYEDYIFYRYSGLTSKKKLRHFLSSFPKDVRSLYNTMKEYEASRTEMNKKKVALNREMLERQIGFLQYKALPNAIDFKEAPPGTLLIAGLYVDKTETLNVSWSEFLYYKLRDPQRDSLDALNLIPIGFADVYQNPYYRDRPVINVTYEQALAYCEWRSEFVSKRLGIKITYRLPSPEEWSLIAQTLLRENTSQTKSYLKLLGKEQVKNQGKYFLFNKLDLFVNDNKVYNFFGNVTEMTSIKGIGMGLNNGDRNLDAIRSMKETISYLGPDPYLGFRCVAVVER